MIYPRIHYFAVKKEVVVQNERARGGPLALDRSRYGIMAETKV
jgi:hypothetical protein